MFKCTAKKDDAEEVKGRHRVKGEVERRWREEESWGRNSSNEKKTHTHM